MNLRHKRKAWKKFQAGMMGEESGFGRITPREEKAAMELFVWHLRRVASASQAVAVSVAALPKIVQGMVKR